MKLKDLYSLVLGTGSMASQAMQSAGGRNLQGASSTKQVNAFLRGQDGGDLLIYLNVTESEGRQRRALVAGTSHITWVIGTYSLFVGDIEASLKFCFFKIYNTLLLSV